MFKLLGNFFTVTLYQPLFNALVFIYNYVPGHDFGLAIILLTIAIRLVLYPLSVKALHSQQALQKLQPKVKEIQEKYKDDKERQARETLEIYRTEKINPFSGLALALVQLPVLIALYQVFSNGLKSGELELHLYQFIGNPGVINPMFLGLINLSQPSWYFAAVAGILQFWQTKMLVPKAQKNAGQPDMTAMMQRYMMYFFPVITVVILIKLPSALALYWIISSIFSIIQQYLMFKKYPAINP